MADLSDKRITLDVDDLQEYYENSDFVFDIDKPETPIYDALTAAVEAAISINAGNTNYKATALSPNTFISNLLRLISGMVRASVDEKTGEQITGAAIRFTAIGGSKEHYTLNELDNLYKQAKACYEIFGKHIDDYLEGEKLYTDTVLVDTEAQASEGLIQVWKSDDGQPQRGYVDENGDPHVSDSGDYIIKPLGYKIAPYIDEDTGEQIGLLIAWGRAEIYDTSGIISKDHIVYPAVSPKIAMDELKKLYPGTYTIKYDSEDAADKTQDVIKTKDTINGGDPQIKNLYQSISKVIKTYAERGRTGGAFAYADFAWGVQSQQQMYEIYHSYDDDAGGNAIWKELEDKGYLVKQYQSQYPPYEEYGLKIAWGANDLEEPDDEERDRIITKDKAMELLDVATPEHAVDTEEKKNIVAPRAEDLIETAFSGTEALSVTLNSLIGETIENTVVALKNNIIEKGLNYVVVDTTQSTNAALSAFILGKEAYKIKHQALELYKDETYAETSVEAYNIGKSITLPSIMDDLGYIAYQDKEKTKPFYLQIDGEDKYVVFGYFDKNAIIEKLIEDYIAQYQKEHDGEQPSEAEVIEYTNTVTADDYQETLWEQFISEILTPIIEELQSDINETVSSVDTNQMKYYVAADGSNVLEINMEEWGISNYTSLLSSTAEEDRLNYWKDFFAYLNKQLKNFIKKKNKQIKNSKITNVNQTTIIKIPFSSVRRGGDKIKGLIDAFARRNILSSDVKINGETRGFRYSGGQEGETRSGGASMIQALSDMGWNLIWRQGHCLYTDLRSSHGRPMWDERKGPTPQEGVDSVYDLKMSGVEENDLWSWDKEVYYKFKTDKDGNKQRENPLNAQQSAINKNKLAAIEAVSFGVSTNEFSETFPHAPLYDVKMVTNSQNSKYYGYYADPHPIYSFYWSKRNKINDLKPPAFGTNCIQELLGPELTSKQKLAINKNYYIYKDMGPNIYGVIDPNEDPYDANSARSFSYGVKKISSESTTATSSSETEIELKEYSIGAGTPAPTAYVTLPYDEVENADGIIVVFSDYTSQIYPSETILRYVMETDWEYDLQDGKAVDGYYSALNWKWDISLLDEMTSYNKKKNGAYWTYVYSALRNIKGQRVKPSSPNVLQTAFNNLQEQIARAEGVANPTKY